MEDKIGVFICKGYGIADSLDIDALSKVATEEYKLPFCKVIESCEKKDLESVLEDIKKENLNKVAIAGISSRRYIKSMFPGNLLIEMIPLREHVVWTQPAGEEDTQMMAEDYLRMYIAKLQKMEPLEPFPYEEAIDKKIMVIGGGITGLTAAIEAADAGYDVILIEKNENLGGWLSKQYKSIPTKFPFRELEDTNIDTLIKKVSDNSRIKVYTSAETSKISGAPGLFDVTISSSTNGSGDKKVLETMRIGAIIQATGWRPNDPRNSIPYGNVDDVVLNVELEEIIKNNGKIIRPSDKKEVKSIAFIQCGGSKDKEHHSYCSAICCLTTVKQALYLRELNKDTKAYVFYEFIRTPGHYEDFYKRAQEDQGIFFTKGMVTDVKQDGEKNLLVTVQDTMVGEQIQVKVDMVVLASGMVPNSADGEKIRALVDAKKVLESDEKQELKDKAVETIEQLKHHEGTEILNLEYRQGPDLPTLEYGFPDSHFICFHLYGRMCSSADE
jgi:quinone-modifying oxidoreductase subunit QmoB